MILAVEDDPWIRLFQIILDPATPPARTAAFAHFVAHDLPDFSGWLTRLRENVGSLYPSEVRLVKDEADFTANLAGATVAAVESFAVGEKEIAAADGALKIVQKYGAVTTSIDRAACERAGVRVLTLKRRANVATAEHAFALMLALARKIHASANRISVEQLQAAGYDPAVFDRTHTANGNWGRVLNTLASGRIGGFGLDVPYDEPGRADDPLLGFPNVVITPHLGASPRQNSLDDFIEMLTNLARALGTV